MDGNILNEDLTNGDDLDLASEELDFISNCDIGENENLISSTGLSEKSPISNQNPDTSSQELINWIETANDGDTILIEPGTYKLHGINITKNISLQGNGNPHEVMKVRMNTIDITIPLNNKYKVGDRLLALISYDNIFIMNSLQKSSIRNNFKGTIVELTLIDDMIRAKIDVDGVIFYSDITLSASKELDLVLGQEVYIGFKALAIATLKL